MDRDLITLILDKTNDKILSTLDELDLLSQDMRFLKIYVSKDGDIVLSEREKERLEQHKRLNELLSNPHEKDNKPIMHPELDILDKMKAPDDLNENS